MRPTATLAEQAQVRELAVVVDGPHAGRWYWRDDLEAMARSAERMGCSVAHPAAVFTRYRPGRRDHHRARPADGPTQPACAEAASMDGCGTFRIPDSVECGWPARGASHEFSLCDVEHSQTPR